MIREKAIDATPDRDTDAEHAGERSRRSRIDALREVQIAARPQQGIRKPQTDKRKIDNS